MDIMIPLGKGSIWNDNELRYCLRSVEKYLTGFNRVIIVGELPPWLVGVVHIPMEDLPGNGNRDLNILNKIMRCLSEPWVTDDIFFMNDDHFMLKNFDVNTFPTLWDMTLNEKINSIKQFTPYRRTMENTVKVLQDKRNFGHAFSTIHFDVHCPIIYNKEQFLNIFRIKFPNFGAGIKSLYGNMAKIGASFQCDDLKFGEPLMRSSIMQALEGRSFFSIGNRCLKGEIKVVLDELYPNKSKFER